MRVKTCSRPKVLMLRLAPRIYDSRVGSERFPTSPLPRRSPAARA